MSESSEPTDPIDSGSGLRKILARLGQAKTYPPRTIIIHEGDPGGALYLIQEGSGRIYSTNEAGKEIVFRDFVPGDLLGELSLDGGVRTASVMTTERTVAAVIRADEFKQLVMKDHAVAYEVICGLIDLVRKTNAQLKSLALQDVYGRVTQLLMGKAVQEDDKLVVHDRLTQQEIADRVGSSREMVSRIFRDLERGGYLSIEKDRMVFHRKPPARW